MEESDRRTSSEDGSNYGEVFASERSLQDDIGGKVLSLLPELRTLRFFTHGVEEKHRICLHVGTYEDVKSRAKQGVYVFLGRHRKLNSSPPVSIVKSQINTEADDSRPRISKDNPGYAVQPDNWSTFADDDSLDLVRPFGALRHKPEEFRAVAKFYFILAAEAHVHGYKEHRILQNKSFEDQLRKGCNRLKSLSKSQSRRKKAFKKFLADCGELEEESPKYNIRRKRSIEKLFYSSDDAAVESPEYSIHRNKSIEPGVAERSAELKPLEDIDAFSVNRFKSVTKHTTGQDDQSSVKNFEEANNQQRDDLCTEIESSDNENILPRAKGMNNLGQALRSKKVESQNDASRVVFSQQSPSYERNNPMPPEFVDYSEITRSSFRTQHEQLRARYDDLEKRKQDMKAANERLRIEVAEIDEEMSAVHGELMQLWETDVAEN